jgi:hypothetical protein
MIFPPAFFDIMMHLPVHVAWAAELGGPVSYRWMYPVERYLCTLKGYVRNKACPEDWIAGRFCSRFFEDVISTKLNRPERQEKSTVSEPSSDLNIFASMDYNRKKTSQIKTASSFDVHRMRHYIISNCDEAIPWIKQAASRIRFFFQ